MVRLTKIYTRGGDQGETSLTGGARVLKCDTRVAAYGAIDETNAAIGVARTHTTADPILDRILARVQNELFDLGADLSTPTRPDEYTRPALRITEGQVANLESDIDRLNSELPPLESFVLPAGSAAASALHVARTTARRAERDVAHLGQSEPVSAPARAYINRLSDFLFVAARWANRKAGVADVLWVPGASR